MASTKLTNLRGPAGPAGGSDAATADWLANGSQSKQALAAKIGSVRRLGDFYRPVSTTQYPTANFTGGAPVVGTVAPAGLTLIQPDAGTINYNGTLTAYSAGYKILRTSALSSAPFSTEEFQHTGGRVVLRVIHQVGQVWQLYVNDQPVFNSVQTPGATAITYIDLPFASRGTRTIRLMGTGTLVFGGVYVPNFETIQLPARRFRLALYGDSYAARANNMIMDVPAYWLAMATGFDVYECAQPGTGYCNPNTAGGGGRTIYNDTGRLAFMNSYDPDAELWLGSINDAGYPAATVQAAAAAAYAAEATLRPQTPLIVVGAEPVTPAGTVKPATYATTNAAVLAAAAAAPNVTKRVDWFNELWMTGNGSTAAPAGNGSQDWLAGLDGLHLDKVGAELIYKRMVAAIADAPLGKAA